MNLRRAKFVAAFVVVGVLVVFGITFTASPTPKSPSAEANKEESVVTKEKKILVVWYSFSCGNTRKIAKQLQVALNADYAEIEPVTPYPPYGGWDSEVTRQGQREVEAGYQPEIKPLTINVADYDVIAVGTPTWCLAALLASLTRCLYRCPKSLKVVSWYWSFCHSYSPYYILLFPFLLGYVYVVLSVSQNNSYIYMLTTSCFCI